MAKCKGQPATIGDSKPKMAVPTNLAKGCEFEPRPRLRHGRRLETSIASLCVTVCVSVIGLSYICDTVAGASDDMIDRNTKIDRMARSLVTTEFNGSGIIN